MLNKKITIKSIEIKVDGRKYVLKDENDDKFNFWKTKKDGGNTKAYDFFIQNNLSVGSVVEIGYKSEDKEYNGNKYEDRTILAFKLPTGRAPQAPAASGTGQIGHLPTPQNNGVLEAKINALTLKLNEIQFAVHALWAVLIQGDKEKEDSYEMHKIPIIGKSKPIEEEEIGESKELNVPF